MALFTPGPLVGQVSGRLGGSIFSHNRGGPYIRNGAIPVSSMSEYSLAVKAAFGAASQAWRSLTDDQRQAWKTWAGTNPVTNRLGSSTVLQGNAAFVSLNARIHAIGEPIILDPPVVASPDALVTMTPTYDIGAGDFSFAFTATPLGATERLFVQVAVVDSPGINYVKNLIKLVDVSPAAEAGPFDIEGAVVDRFGTLIVGQKVVLLVSVFDEATGLLSAPITDEGVVVSTA